LAVSLLGEAAILLHAWLGEALIEAGVATEATLLLEAAVLAARLLLATEATSDGRKLATGGTVEAAFATHVVLGSLLGLTVTSAVDVLSDKALVGLGDSEGTGLAVVQASETLLLDRGLMGENVLLVIGVTGHVDGDKTKTLLGVEELARSFDVVHV